MHVRTCKHTQNTSSTTAQKREKEIPPIFSFLFRVWLTVLLELLSLSLSLSLFPKSMRIRNRALTFSAFSSTLFSDPSSIPEIKHQHGKEEKGHEHEGEEEMHMNPDHKHLNRSYYSNHSLPLPKKDRSRSKEEDQLRQVNGEIYEQGCKNCTEISSRLLPYQEDFATVEEGEGDEEELWSASHKRSKNLGAQTVGGGAVSGARWSERESTFPLKKRKNKYEFMVVGSSEKKKNKSKKKNQRKKEEEEEDNTSGDQTVINVKKVKKNNSKSREMEGSRCSRVNGRGWRCCQATLVGYSLCEHHLGKGRLKSINNSLGQSSSSTNTSCKTIRSPKKEQVIEDEDEDEDCEEMKTKKKKRAGVVVKARSMSSLLG